MLKKKHQGSKKTLWSEEQREGIANDESESESFLPSSLESENSKSALQERELSPTCTFTCLRKWNEQKMNDCFKEYITKLSNCAAPGPKVGSRKIFNAETFTPWWDAFSKSTRKYSSKGNASTSKDLTASVSASSTFSCTNCLRVSNLSFSVTDPDAFDNWFDKSQCADSSSNWFCGPGPSQPSTSSTAQGDAPVQDIEVPSIYDQQPKTKGRRALKKERRAERDKTLGKKWFEMRAPDVDENMRNDMELIQMRGVLDPKRFYKHSDRRALPKYFQMGTVVDEGTDFYSSRLTKKQRKQTLVEELMADASIRQYNKRKYSEVQQKMRNKKFKGKKQTSS